MWMLTKRSKIKFQSVDIKFLRNTEGETRRDRVMNVFVFREETGIQNLITEL
jgi:hypothetical protein